MRISIRKSQRFPAKLSQSCERRQGFSLIEVIVAMVLLAVAVSSLAGLVYSVSRSGIRTTGDAYRNGVVMHEVNRLEGIPFAAVTSSSETVGTGNYPHTREITVVDLASNIKKVTLVVRPVNPLYKPDTVIFLRTNARTSRVLCTDCALTVNQQ
jgi:prepilin-type N-terminal cleavage/methylation domain-containing protein